MREAAFASESGRYVTGLPVRRGKHGRCPEGGLGPDEGPGLKKFNNRMNEETVKPDATAESLDSAEIVCKGSATSIVERLCEARWGVRSELREALVGRMTEIALTAKPRTAVAAFQALVVAERLDLQAVEVAAKVAATQLVAERARAVDVASDEEVQRGLAMLLENAETGSAEEPAVPRVRVHDAVDGYEVA